MKIRVEKGLLYWASRPNMPVKRDPIMTIKRSVVILALLLGAASLSGCLAIYEDGESVCPHGDPNADNWPYCGGARPGGSQPADDGPRY